MKKLFLFIFISFQTLALEKVPSGQVEIINLNWFSPQNGLAKYFNYIQKVTPFAMRFGMRPQMPAFQASGIDTPHLIAIATYPSYEQFESFYYDDEYQASFAPLRHDSLERANLLPAQAEKLSPIENREELKFFVYETFFLKWKFNRKNIKKALSAKAQNLLQRSGGSPHKVLFPFRLIEGHSRPDLIMISGFKTQLERAMYLTKSREFRQKEAYLSPNYSQFLMELFPMPN